MKTKFNNAKSTIALLTFLLFTSCKNDNYQSAQTEDVKTETPKESPIERGKYLVIAMGCNHCHSPKKMGPNGPEIIPELMLSGFPSDREIIKFDDPLIKEGFALFYPDLTAAAGPWGVAFAGNITPDPTGIGTWTEDQFKRAFTQGKYKGMENGRTLLPPMPWYDFAELNDEDIHAIFMYLKSINPVDNVVPAPIPPDKMG